MAEPQIKRFCEFPGSAEVDYDEVSKSERLCEHAGFGNCTLHHEEILEDCEGFRLCCDKCVTPQYWY